MNLTIDANILVSELDPETGWQHSLLLNPAFGTLLIAEFTWNEAIYILEHRIASWVRTGRLTEGIGKMLLDVTKRILAERCTIVAEDFYHAFEVEARRRAPDDPDDWHSIALALATETAIWTLDQKHFFGCGVAVWKTSVLRSALVATA